jgi:hypothetical protein
VTNEECDKKRFSSREKARSRLRGYRYKPGNQGFRARVYYCQNCHAYHITNHEKSGSTTSGNSTRKQKKRRQDHKRARQQGRKNLRNWGN